MLVHMISMHVVQMAVVEIIGVSIVPHRGVAAFWAVGVRMFFLFHAGSRHFIPFFCSVASRKDNRSKRQRVRT